MGIFWAKHKRRILADLYRQQDGRCWWCGRGMVPPWLRNQEGMRDDVATIEHVIPRSKGGSNARSNLRAACHQCNNARGDLVNCEWVENQPDYGG